MPNWFSRLCMIVVTSMFTTVASAQDRHVTGFWDFGFTMSTVQPDVAKQVGIGEHGFGLWFDAAAVRHRIFVFGVEGSFQWGSDKQPFSVMTTGGPGNSMINLADFALLTGANAPRLKLGSTMELQVGCQAGFGAYWAQRGTHTSGSSVCVDCPNDNLHIGGGLFAAPTVTLINSTGLRSTVSMRFYRNGTDVRRMLFLGFGLDLPAK